GVTENAQAKAVLGGPNGDTVTRVEVTVKGKGYTQIPAVQFSSGSASAKAVISTSRITTLDGGIDSSQTTLKESSIPALLPLEGQFTIRIGNETMLVTADSAKTKTWTIVRGAVDPRPDNPFSGKPTPREAHSNGDQIFINSGVYDALDPYNQGYRGYIGEQVGNQVNLGLQPHHQVTLQVPLVFWDSGRLMFIDGGPNGVQSLNDPFNPLNPASDVWNFEEAAKSFIVNADLADPARANSANPNGRVMWYHALAPKDFGTAAPAQLSEWSFRDPNQAGFAPNIFWDQLLAVNNYDVSYVDNLTFPVVMEVTNEPIVLPPTYTGPAIPPAPYGAVGADMSLQQMQQAFVPFTAITPGQDNTLLGKYFGGKGYDKFFFPSGLDTMIKLPAG